MSEEKEPPQTDNWWKPRPGELPVVNVLVVIVGFVSAVAALVALFVHGSMAILVWSAAIAFLTVALLIAFFRIRKRRVQLPLLAVLAGIVVLIGIAAVGLVVIVRARGPIQTAPSGPSASAQRTSSSAMTSASSEPTAISPGLVPKLVFSDRFCTAVGGWTVGSSRTGGHYDRCAFRIYANANDIESSEPHARTVYPAAPSGIEITVTARRRHRRRRIYPAGPVSERQGTRYGHRYGQSYSRRYRRDIRGNHLSHSDAHGSRVRGLHRRSALSPAGKATQLRLNPEAAGQRP